MTRGSELYISPDTLRGLRYVAMKQSGEDRETADAIGDKALIEWIAAQHPDVAAHIAQRNEQEKEFLKSIKPKGLPCSP